MALVVAILLAIFVLPAPWNWAAVVVGGTIEVAESFFWIWLSRRRRPTVGTEALIGVQARVVSPCRPFGRVKLDGELWSARCDAGADIGDLVRVEAVEGLTLVVT
jgi:membrane protein implicated in regulation of membrane protease activity